MINILLSTYNGEKYLIEQIESIIHQTNKDWRLIIRDDGSTDNTIEIINRYHNQYPNKIEVLIDKLGNVGIIKSFEILLNKKVSDYYMFCDQDDVWFKRKIELSLQEMKKTEKTTTKGIMVFTDLKVVDEDLKTIAPSFLQQNKIRLDIGLKFKYICVANPVAGCTIMLNQRAKETVLPFADKIPMHDWWMSSIIAKKGIIKCINQPTIYYRQHKNNAWGSKKNSKFHHIKRIIKINTTLKEFAKLKPFLAACGFGNLYKFWFTKLEYFILRRL